MADNLPIPTHETSKPVPTKKPIAAPITQISPIKENNPQDTDDKKSAEPNNVTSTISTGDFNWDGFLDKVREMNDAVYTQLLKTKFEFTEGCLELYPEKRIVKTILSRDNNKRILIDATNGSVKITIHEAGETPSNATNDTVLAKISDIMGGEVRNDGGENPFGE